MEFDQHHPWGPIEAAIAMTIIDWKLSVDGREVVADTSDLMDTALTRIKGVMMGAISPDDVLEVIGLDIQPVTTREEARKDRDHDRG